MKYHLIAGAAALTLLGTATMGLAQAQDRDRGRGGGASDAPRAEPRAEQRQAPNVERSRPQSAPRVERAPERRAVEQPRRERPQRAEPRQREQAPQRTERQREQQSKAVERQRSEPKKQQAAPKREQAPDREKQATPKRDQAPDRTDRQKADRKNDAPDRSQARNPRGDSQQVNRVQASNEQRKQVRDDVFRERGVNRISRKDFGVFIAVGSRVHRRHRLHHLTPAILVFAPMYRGYDYIIVDDTICIVDPETYIIVDVLPSSMDYADGQRPQLALSASEMAFIYASVPKDRTADVRIRLALGAEVPSSVEVQAFPEGVIERVPQIQAYGYIVVNDDVVVVEPYDREVALVITE